METIIQEIAEKVIKKTRHAFYITAAFCTLLPAFLSYSFLSLIIYVENSLTLWLVSAAVFMLSFLLFVLRKNRLLKRKINDSKKRLEDDDYVALLDDDFKEKTAA